MNSWGLPGIIIDIKVIHVEFLPFLKDFLNLLIALEKKGKTSSLFKKLISKAAFQPLPWDAEKEIHPAQIVTLMCYVKVIYLDVGHHFICVWLKDMSDSHFLWRKIRFAVKLFLSLSLLQTNLCFTSKGWHVRWAGK